MSSGEAWTQNILSLVEHSPTELQLSSDVNLLNGQ